MEFQTTQLMIYQYSYIIQENYQLQIKPIYVKVFRATSDIQTCVLNQHNRLNQILLGPKNLM